MPRKSAGQRAVQPDTASAEKASTRSRTAKITKSYFEGDDSDENEPVKKSDSAPRKSVSRKRKQASTSDSTKSKSKSDKRKSAKDGGNSDYEVSAEAEVENKSESSGESDWSEVESKRQRKSSGQTVRTKRVSTASTKAKEKKPKKKEDKPKKKEASEGSSSEDDDDWIEVDHAQKEHVAVDDTDLLEAVNRISSEADRNIELVLDPNLRKVGNRLSQAELDKRKNTAQQRAVFDSW